MALSIYSIDDVLDTNPEGIDLIKRCESFEPNWYKCPANVWTIGYGTTEGSLPGLTRERLTGPIDEETADRLLVRGLITQYEPSVERHGLFLNPNQFSALVSFVYNVGGSAFAKSTMLRKLKSGDPNGAADEFLRWVKAGGNVLGGLVRRRQAERALFLEEPEDVRQELVARLERMPVMSISSLRTRRPEVPTFLENPYKDFFAES